MRERELAVYLAYKLVEEEWTSDSLADLTDFVEEKIREFNEKYKTQEEEQPTN